MSARYFKMLIVTAIICVVGLGVALFLSRRIPVLGYPTFTGPHNTIDRTTATFTCYGIVDLDAEEERRIKRRMTNVSETEADRE